ncbi:MAG: response regulator transcription factor [Fibrobacter sp.]|jgi:two-component system alkaline phosphatase synthesis response regulator PhoP|nr:response regulator transcription factor [Fibrobacter sp.]
MICIVEDDSGIRELEVYALQSAGYSVTAFPEARAFYSFIERELPELVILDVMLPGDDGLHILNRLRSHQKTKSIPVIMVTAKSSEIDRVKGLDSGADDYLVKPFGVMEFLSRVKALLRRSAPQKTEQPAALSLGEIRMDLLERKVTVDGNEVELTYKEYELLHLLLSKAGMVFTRDRIMGAVWDVDNVIESRTVDMHIKTLRQKLGTAGRYIKTVRNVGYKIESK